MAAIVEVHDLHKHFGPVHAVNGVSFSVEEGTCFGMLGPNGAGKTTTVEIMEGITPPTAGEVRYRGGPLDARFRAETGIQFQSTALQDYLTVAETLRLFHRLSGAGGGIERVVETCRLGDLLERDARRLSGGQRQRLLLAVALVNDPRLVFLDEPTTGLDPQARRNFWDLIEDIKRAGKTVLLTTHYMEEAYRLCDTIAIMDNGLIIAQGSPDELLKEHFEDVILELPRGEFTIEPDELPFQVLAGEDVVEISTADVNDAVRLLVERGVSLNHLTIRPRTLEDLFLELTGRELRG
jgi:ABC-2 type transport system ATP-binding protein